MILTEIGMYLGRKIRSPDGEGILIGIDTPFNGATFDVTQSKAQVWYGVEDAQNGWVAHTYPIEQITPTQPKDCISYKFMNLLKQYNCHKVTINSTYYDCGFDSLDEIDFLMSVEEEFNVEFSDDQLSFINDNTLISDIIGFLIASL